MIQPFMGTALTNRATGMDRKSHRRISYAREVFAFDIVLLALIRKRAYGPEEDRYYCELHYILMSGSLKGTKNGSKKVKRKKRALLMMALLSQGWQWSVVYISTYHKPDLAGSVMLSTCYSS